MITGHAFIIGSMKAGTTALFKQLSQHPAIAQCSKKEPGFLAGSVKEVADLGPYRDLWDWNPALHRWALEASTGYSKAPFVMGIAGRLESLGAESRIIYMVRNPIQRIRSHYLHGVAAGFVERGIDEHLLLLAMVISNYHFQLLPYEMCCSPGQLLVLDYARYNADPLAVLKECCRFLDIDENFGFDSGQGHNSSTDYLVVLLAKLAQEKGLVAAVPPELTRRGALTEGLINWLIEQLPDSDPTERITQLVDSAGRMFQPSPSHEAEIHDFLDADLRRFEERHGIDPWAST